MIHHFRCLGRITTYGLLSDKENYEVLEDIRTANLSCMFSDSYAVVDKVLSVDGSERTSANNQMQLLCCIHRGAEVAPIRQHTHRQTTAAKQ